MNTLMAKNRRCKLPADQRPRGARRDRGGKRDKPAS